MSTGGTPSRHKERGHIKFQERLECPGQGDLADTIPTAMSDSVQISFSPPIYHEETDIGSDSAHICACRDASSIMEDYLELLSTGKCDIYRSICYTVDERAKLPGFFHVIAKAVILEISSLGNASLKSKVLSIVFSTGYNLGINLHDLDGELTSQSQSFPDVIALSCLLRSAFRQVEASSQIESAKWIDTIPRISPFHLMTDTPYHDANRPRSRSIPTTPRQQEAYYSPQSAVESVYSPSTSALQQIYGVLAGLPTSVDQYSTLAVEKAVRSNSQLKRKDAPLKAAQKLREIVQHEEDSSNRTSPSSSHSSSVRDSPTTTTTASASNMEMASGANAAGEESNSGEPNLTSDSFLRAGFREAATSTLLPFGHALVGRTLEQHGMNTENQQFYDKNSLVSARPHVPRLHLDGCGGTETCPEFYQSKRLRQDVYPYGTAYASLENHAFSLHNSTSNNSNLMVAEWMMALQRRSSSSDEGHGDFRNYFASLPSRSMDSINDRRERELLYGEQIATDLNRSSRYVGVSRSPARRRSGSNPSEPRRISSSSYSPMASSSTSSAILAASLSPLASSSNSASSFSLPASRENVGGLARRRRYRFYQRDGTTNAPNVSLSDPGNVLIKPKGVYPTKSNGYRVQLNQVKGSSSKFSRNVREYGQAVWLYEIAVLISDRPPDLQALLSCGNYMSIVSMKWLSSHAEYYRQLGERVVQFANELILRDEEVQIAVETYDSLIFNPSDELTDGYLGSIVDPRASTVDLQHVANCSSSSSSDYSDASLMLRSSEYSSITTANTCTTSVAGTCISAEAPERAVARSSFSSPRDLATSVPSGATVDVNNENNTRSAAEIEDEIEEKEEEEEEDDDDDIEDSGYPGNNPHNFTPRGHLNGITSVSNGGGGVPPSRHWAGQTSLRARNSSCLQIFGRSSLPEYDCPFPPSAK